MNYVCVSINKEVVNREVFSDKQQAVAYFQTLHGERIREEKEGLKRRLENNIANYESRIRKELIAEEKYKATSTAIQKRFYEEWEAHLKELCKRKATKESDLAKLEADIDKIEVVYEAKYNGYKDNLYTQEPQLILHISGIYQNGYLFTVIEEKYYFIGAKIESEEPACSVVKKLPSHFNKDRISLYLFKEIEGEPEVVELDNQDRIQKTVTRIRNQILKNFQYGPSRVKEM